MFILSATNPLKHVTIEDSKSGKILDLVKIKKEKKCRRTNFSKFWNFAANSKNVTGTKKIISVKKKIQFLTIGENSK